MFKFFKKKDIPLTFEELVDQQLNIIFQRFDIKLFADEKLLGKVPYKVRYAFFYRFERYSKLINILTLPQSIQFNDTLEKELLRLRNYILSKNCMLIVIYEQRSDYEKVDHLLEFLIEDFDLISDNYYSIPFYKEKAVDILDEISNILSEAISFEGPRVSRQIVNIEVAEDECWKCHKKMMTVTGVVFPNMKLNDWNNTKWQYYLQSLSIVSIPSGYIELISNEVTNLRIKNQIITPLKLKYSYTIKESYWAACCPYCDSLRGDNYIHEVIMPYLHDINSRLTPSLNYYSLELDVKQDLLNVLYSGGYDTSLHSCNAGWKLLS